MKPANKRTRLIFMTTGLVFSGNFIQGLTSRPWLWCAAAFGSYLLAAVMNVNLDTLMREKVPMEMQGRVFSAKSTLQNFTIPTALLLGGLLADTVFEPFMMEESPVQHAILEVQIDDQVRKLVFLLPGQVLFNEEGDVDV